MSPRWEPDPDVRRERSVIYKLHVHLIPVGTALQVTLLLRRVVGGAPLSIIKKYIDQQKRPD